ncbi:hypothetical protein [Tuberibacillus sp. Marseille-P3662]|uniref:hypothetical protein n=1 Tax=Tuberibacillus sp. Marseille-P3662 TaxID=1965358 RepID=UPI0020CAD783|nr:hypothetical protein [Tuberibacillus sp. Marseille-P3662]
MSPSDASDHVQVDPTSEMMVPPLWTLLLSPDPKGDCEDLNLALDHTTICL